MLYWETNLCISQWQILDDKISNLDTVTIRALGNLLHFHFPATVLLISSIVDISSIFIPFFFFCQDYCSFLLSHIFSSELLLILWNSSRILGVFFGDSCLVPLYNASLFHFGTQTIAYDIAHISIFLFLFIDFPDSPTSVNFSRI